ASTPRSSASSRSSATLNSPRIAAPSSVTVSMVPTPSYNGVEAATRRTPPPARGGGRRAAPPRPRPPPPPQPRPHVHQHRMTEAGVVERQPTTGILPPRIETERLDRFPVREAPQPLQHHHRGD